MSISQLFTIILAHRRAELAALLASLAVAIALSVILPKQYTATASMFVDVRSPDRIDGIVPQSIAGTGYMATQADIVKSDRVVLAVVDVLKLDQRGVIRAKWRAATDGKVELDPWIAELLKKNLRVAPASASSVFNISFSGDTPAFSAEVANAFAREYLAVLLELKLEPARLSAAWFEAQARRARAHLELAQKALSDYQQQAGVLESDNRIDAESARLNEMVMQLTRLQAETAERQNKRQAANANSVEEVMKSEVVGAMKIDVARLEAKLKEESESLDANHPRIIRMQQELAAMKTQLAGQITLVANSIETSYQIGKQRELALQRAITDQKNLVLALDRQRGELNVYKRDLESAQRAFGEVSQRAAQTRLESLSNQADVVSLSAARPPTIPSRPSLFFNLAVAACAGSMLAFGLGLLLELMNRRVRSHHDLAGIGLPVLAAIRSADWPTAAEQPGQGRFVANLKGSHHG
jgi:chain length determinant protein EpsF